MKTLEINILLEVKNANIPEIDSYEIHNDTLDGIIKIGEDKIPFSVTFKMPVNIISVSIVDYQVIENEMSLDIKVKYE